MDIAKDVLSLLEEKNLKISTAESCTGGLVAKLITDIPGSSAFFEMGFVTYSNEAKAKLLGVDEETLKTYGAVSDQTARQMCEGAKTVANSDIAVCTTGIAGPGGGSEQKPVGLVFIGVCGRAGTVVKKCNFSGTREEIRSRTAEYALNLVREYISENY